MKDREPWIVQDDSSYERDMKCQKKRGCEDRGRDLSVLSEDGERGCKPRNTGNHEMLQKGQELASPLRVSRRN